MYIAYTISKIGRSDVSHWQRIFFMLVNSEPIILKLCKLAITFLSTQLPHATLTNQFGKQMKLRSL